MRRVRCASRRQLPGAELWCNTPLFEDLSRRLFKIIDACPFSHHGSRKRPVIGIPADRRMIGPHPFHAVGEKYARAVLRSGRCACRCSSPRWRRAAFDRRAARSRSMACCSPAAPRTSSRTTTQGPPSRAGHAARPGARCHHASADPQGGRARACRCWASAADSRR